MSAGTALRITLATVFLAAAAGVGALFIAPLVLDDSTASADEPVVQVDHGVIYDLPVRVLNLSAGGQFNFVKIDVALELERPDELSVGHGADPEAAFLAAFDDRLVAVEDGINSAISARTSDDLRSAEGKAALKEAIRQLAGAALAHPVRNVFFTQFVMQ